MLTFAAAVAGVAATVGCGSAANGRAPEPRPILTAPPRAIMTPYGMGIVSRTEPQADDVAAAIDLAAALQLQAACDTRWGGERDGADERVPVVCEAVDSASPGIAPVPTAMVAASKDFGTAEPALKKTPPNFQVGVEQWRPLVESIFPAFAVETMLRVVRCESSGNPAAHNVNPATGDDSVGLMQVNLHASLLPGRLALLQSLGYEAWDRDSAVAILKDPEANLRAAYRISGGGTSWGAWTCR
jgi:hypothetical protein